MSFLFFFLCERDLRRRTRWPSSPQRACPPLTRPPGRPWTLTGDVQAGAESAVTRPERRPRFEVTARLGTILRQDPEDLLGDCAPVAHRIERMPAEHEVAGSTPARRTSRPSPGSDRVQLELGPGHSQLRPGLAPLWPRGLRHALSAGLLCGIPLRGRSPSGSCPRAQLCCLGLRRCRPSRNGRMGSHPPIRTARGGESDPSRLKRLARDSWRTARPPARAHDH